MIKKDNILVQIKNSNLAQNIFYLFVTQGVNYLLPFLALPFLFRVLGEDTYGIVATAYSYYIFLVIVIDFGFEYYSTRRISQNSNDLNMLNVIVTETYVSKILVLLVCILATLVIVGKVDNFRSNASVFYYMLGIPIGQALFPMYFFQGMQRMKYVTIITTTTKCSSFLPMFILVHSSDDVNVVSLCYSLGYVLSAFVSIIIMMHFFSIRFVRVNLKGIWESIKKSSLFFLSRVSASSYCVGTTIILNVICGNVVAGYYDVASKLVTFATNLINPVTQSLYPYMSASNKVNVMRGFLIYGSIFGLILFLSFEFASQWIMELVFGVTSPEAINTFRILTLALLFVMPSYLSGYPLLAARGHDKYVNVTVIMASIIFLIIVLILYLIGMVNIYTMSVTYLIAEFFVFSSRITGVYKYKLLK